MSDDTFSSQSGLKGTNPESEEFLDDSFEIELDLSELEVSSTPQRSKEPRVYTLTPQDDADSSFDEDAELKDLLEGLNKPILQKDTTTAEDSIMRLIDRDKRAASTIATPKPSPSLLEPQASKQPRQPEKLKQFKLFSSIFTFPKKFFLSLSYIFTFPKKFFLSFSYIFTFPKKFFLSLSSIFTFPKKFFLSSSSIFTFPKKLSLPSPSSFTPPKKLSLPSNAHYNRIKKFSQTLLQNEKFKTSLASLILVIPVFAIALLFKPQEIDQTQSDLKNKPLQTSIIPDTESVIEEEAPHFFHGEVSNTTFSAQADLNLTDANTLETTVTISTPRPPELTPLEVAEEVPPKPWIIKIKIAGDITPIKDAPTKFKGVLPAKVYLDISKRRTRLLQKVTLQASLDKFSNEGVLKIFFSKNGTAQKNTLYFNEGDKKVLGGILITVK